MLNKVALLIPVFLAVVAFEWFVSYKRGDKRYTTGNTVMNLTIGAVDQVASLAYFAILFFVLQYVYKHFRLIEVTNLWYQWVVGYIAVDFLSYWYHRFSHRINILWAGHITHHSSEQFNLSNGFRTSFFQGLNRIIFWAFLPVFGFSPLVLVIILKVSGIYDFLLHTQYIPKLGIIESFIITPSSHRVHHGKNDVYIDKNYGSTLVIWDKLFGTYQEETEIVRYGITSPYIDNNPFWAIGHQYQHMWLRMKATKLWRDKIKILYMPPEWDFENLKPLSMPGLKTSIPKQFALFQVSCCIFGLLAMLVYYNYLSKWEIALWSFTGLIILTNATLIINENIILNSSKWELVQLITSLLFVSVAMLINPLFYMWPIIIFLVVSLAVVIRRNLIRKIVPFSHYSDFKP